MKTYFFLKSGFISAVMFIVFSLVAAHADAQGRILTADVKIAENTAKNAAKYTIVRGTIQGILNIPQVCQGESIKPVGAIRPQNIDKVKALSAPSLRSLLKLTLSANDVAQRTDKMKKRFLSYATTESQSIDDPAPLSFPMTEGQRNDTLHQYLDSATVKTCRAIPFVQVTPSEQTLHK